MDAQPVLLLFALGSHEGLSRADKYIRRVVAEITFDWRLNRVGAVEGAALALEICSGGWQEGRLRLVAAVKDSSVALIIWSAI